MIQLHPCTNTLADAQQVFAWRNDPETIQASYIAQEKTWDSFWLEFSQYYFREPDFCPFIIFKKDQPVGFIRFEPVVFESYKDNKAIEVMINIAPNYRRQGIATRALALIKQETKTKPVFALIADIRKENQASRRTFEKAGFSFLFERKEFIQKTGEICYILCYRYTL